MTRSINYKDIVFIFFCTLILSVFSWSIPGFDLTAVVTGLWLFMVPGYLFLAILQPHGFKEPSIFFVIPVTSMIISSIVFLLLSYSVGLSKINTIISLLALTIGLSIVLIIRRIISNRYPIRFRSVKFIKPLRTIMVRYLPEIGMILLLTSVLMCLIYNSILSPVQYTEFYLLNKFNEGDEYPVRLKPGEELNVKIGITNHEVDSVDYLIFYSINSANINLLAKVNVEKEKQWQSSFELPIIATPGPHKIVFHLFKKDTNEVYRTLYLWVDASNP